MKDYLRYMIILTLFTFLCNGFVSADSGIASEDKSANDTIKIQPSLVSVSEKDQVKLADIKATLPPEIQQSLDEQLIFNESVTKAIAEKEGELAKSPLAINDSHDITGEVTGFFVANFTTSLEPGSKEPELIQTNVSPSAILLPENQIPTGGFIEFGSDGKTRIFSSAGTQISYVIDDRSEKITTPSGKVLPSTHIIGVPNGAASHTRGNREYITMNGEVILTIIDRYSKDISGLNTVPSPRSSPWVEYAESDPYYIAAIHSNWVIPHSPNLDIPATTSNILFNGIEPSNGSMIFQPVTAFNYFAHSSIIGPGNRTDPAIVNRWTGSSWICPIDTSHCHRSNPVLIFSQGELAYGAVFWYEAPVSKWLVYLVNGNNQGTWQFSDPYDYTQPSRTVVVYEFGGSDPLGLLPNDNQKITSTTFSNISVWDTNGNQISSLHWNGVVNTKDHKKITGLNVDLSQAPSTVILNTSDHRARVGVVRPISTWLLDASGNGIYGGGDIAYTFGTTGDKFVTGDWNADGKTEIGVIRNNNNWRLDASGDGTFGAGDYNYIFGMAGDQYVTGDWTGTGTTKIGVVRNGATWLLDASGNGAYGAGDYSYTFGKTGDQYVTGDWNNNGRTEIGVFRDGTTWLLDASGNGAYGAGDLVYTFGAPGDKSVTGDWNNNGRTEIGVVRSNNNWLLDASGNGAYGAGDLAYMFGQAGDTYVTGKWR
jgi:hypothetical protein